MSEARSPFVRALWLMMSAWGALVALQLVRFGLDLYMRGLLDEEAHHYETVALLSLVSSVIWSGLGPLVMGLLGYAATRLAAAAQDRRTRGLANAMAACLAVSAACYVPWLVAALWTDMWQSIPRAAWQALSYTNLGAALAAYVLFATTVTRAMRAAGARAPVGHLAALAVAAGPQILVGLGLVEIHHDVPATILRHAIYVAPDVALAVLAYAAATGLARRRAAPAPGPGDPYRVGALRGDDPPETARAIAFRDAAEGLNLYARGLAIRLVVFAVGVSLLVLAALTHAADLAKPITVIFVIAAAVTSLMMIVGVFRYTHFPEDHAFAPAAFLSLVLMVAAFVADLYAMKLALDVFFEHVDTSVAGRSAIERLPVAQGVSAVLGLAALFLLLVSFMRVAKILDQPALASRARTVCVLLAILVAIAVSLKTAVAGLEDGRAAMALAFIVLVFGLATCGMYASLVFALSRAMRTHEGAADP